MSTKKNEETVPMKTNKQDETRPSAKTKGKTEDSGLAATKPQKSVKKAQTLQPEEVDVLPQSDLGSPTDAPPAGKPKRAGWVWLGILMMFLIAAAGSAIGYGFAMKARAEAEMNNRLTAAATQFILSQKDIENGDLAMAKSRLEYVIQVYPDYPGAMDKLTTVMVELAKTNPEAALQSAAATPIPTVDTGNLESLFQQAKQQLTGEDWENLYVSVNGIRNTDPTYKSVQVDGMYYMALRNLAIKRINSGHLEVGIYYFTMASKIGPIDTEALGYESRAMMFLNAASSYGVVWERAMLGFQTLYGMVPYMIDVNGVTVTQRYAESLAGYGDTLQSQSDWCGAVKQYELSQSIMSLESVNLIIEDARGYCANPPATPTPTLEPGVTPTGGKKK
jgi:hypothetical protein